MVEVVWSEYCAKSVNGSPCGKPKDDWIHQHLELKFHDDLCPDRHHEFVRVPLNFNEWRKEILGDPFEGGVKVQRGVSRILSLSGRIECYFDKLLNTLPVGNEKAEAYQAKLWVKEIIEQSGKVKKELLSGLENEKQEGKT